MITNNNYLFQHRSVLFSLLICSVSLLLWGTSPTPWYLEKIDASILPILRASDGTYTDRIKVVLYHPEQSKNYQLFRYSITRADSLFLTHWQAGEPTVFFDFDKGLRRKNYKLIRNQ